MRKREKAAELSWPPTEPGHGRKPFGWNPGDPEKAAWVLTRPSGELAGRLMSWQIPDKAKNEEFLKAFTKAFRTARRPLIPQPVRFEMDIRHEMARTGCSRNEAERRVAEAVGIDPESVERVAKRHRVTKK